MFFYVKRVEEAAYNASHLQNPIHPGEPMTLYFVRNYASSAFFSTYSKKAAAMYYGPNHKLISKRKWTPEMHAYVQQQEGQVPQPPFKFKVNFFGYVMLLGVLALFGYLVYDSFIKPPHPESLMEQPMEKPVEANAIYFGHYEKFKEGERVASEVRFGWFKVIENKNGLVKIAPSTQLSAGHQDPKTLNSTDFEPLGIEANITEQAIYGIKLKSTDKLMEFNLTERK